MAKPSRSHDALQQLMDERKRYEQWIATLESRRESTPEHVFKRVHADYDQRLAGVRQQLTERTGEVRSAITGLKDRLKQASEQEAERVDEMHEAELRSVVGELTPEQWELRKREVEVELKRFVDEKKTISDELNQLLLIIEQTADHDMGPELTAPPPAAPAPTASPPPATAVQADATRVRSKTPARSRVAMHNEPATPAESERPPVPIESLAPTGAVAAPAAEQAKEIVGASRPAPSEGPSFQPRAEVLAAAPPAAQSKRAKPSGMAQPADPKRENEKTLKCGECGAMNYPTEWYCESCGGELSAL